MVTPGTVKRVFEIIYVKVLVDQGQILPPSKENMTPMIQELWLDLFEKSESGH